MDELGTIAAVTEALTAAGGDVTGLTMQLTGPLQLTAELPPGRADELAQLLAVAAAELGVEVTLRPAEPGGAAVTA
ncbi:hypothetical protein ACWT_7919 [Actinoplanes sp. SE50]|uniref:hypothetical protein n=1 Tax=unclassified Actinoplanes TaxID=2626549 RepID=UPI00023EDFF2|nr:MULTISPECIES: hypothetical protein [unclassified Actinoplanes]AEV88928.1 hypothetical protein ACPL_8050 [Actinoplanes sp. SE50/110]ATO87334.1 hypothetical protein ACWT_7919 [Actinoplanes sp. SE50]SLM04752.1 hypothetical protein ACSP50_8060 [Actinoplanes sp. SE50/110]